MKGLQEHTNAVTPKLKTLPKAKPPIRQNCAIVAEISTLWRLCRNQGLRRGEGTANKTKEFMYPLLVPNNSMIKKNIRSDLITTLASGGPGGDEGLRKLQAKKIGIKTVRERDR